MAWWQVGCCLNMFEPISVVRELADIVTRGSIGSSNRESLYQRWWCNSVALKQQNGDTPDRTLSISQQNGCFRIKKLCFNEMHRYLLPHITTAYARMCPISKETKKGGFGCFLEIATGIQVLWSHQGSRLDKFLQLSLFQVWTYTGFPSVYGFSHLRWLPALWHRWSFGAWTSFNNQWL